MDISNPIYRSRTVF